MERKHSNTGPTPETTGPAPVLRSSGARAHPIPRGSQGSGPQWARSQGKARGRAMVPRPEHPHMNSLAWDMFPYWPVYMYGLQQWICK